MPILRHSGDEMRIVGMACDSFPSIRETLLSFLARSLRIESQQETAR
jgi:hypothetical protein